MAFFPWRAYTNGNESQTQQTPKCLAGGFLKRSSFRSACFPPRRSERGTSAPPHSKGTPPASVIRGKNDHNLRTSAAFRGCSPYSPPTLPISPDPFDTVAMQEESRTCGYKIPERAANATKHTDRCATRIATRKTCCEVSGQVDIPRATYIPQSRVHGKQTHTK